jgi:predicted NUDIX family NTP pyrophosphohydrolase
VTAPGPSAQRRHSVSAGIVLFRRTTPGRLEVLLGHMGGPFWSAKDEGAWSIPKGEYAPEEAPWDAARREFAEEIGQPPPDGPPIELGQITQRNGKVVTAYALEGDLDPEKVVSNTFEMEWPRGSGRRQSFPEIDRVAWFTVAQARPKMTRSQPELLDRLEAHLSPPD